MRTIVCRAAADRQVRWSQRSSPGQAGRGRAGKASRAGSNPVAGSCIQPWRSTPSPGERPMTHRLILAVLAVALVTAAVTGIPLRAQPAPTTGGWSADLLNRSRDAGGE